MGYGPGPGQALTSMHTGTKETCMSPRTRATRLLALATGVAAATLASTPSTFAATALDTTAPGAPTIDEFSGLPPTPLHHRPRRKPMPRNRPERKNTQDD